jgi:hypothetical protein
VSDVKSRFNPDWLTGVFTTIIAFISVAALIYAHLQLKEAHEESQVQHLLSLQQQYEQEPMVTYRKIYATKRLAGVEDPPERYKMLDFFEEVALLVKRGYLSDTDVWKTFSSEIFPLYADSRDTIEQDRKKDDPVEYAKSHLAGESARSHRKRTERRALPSHQSRTLWNTGKMRPQLA